MLAGAGPAGSRRSWLGAGGLLVLLLGRGWGPSAVNLNCAALRSSSDSRVTESPKLCSEVWTCVSGQGRQA